jgi:hypothetical protein
VDIASRRRRAIPSVSFPARRSELAAGRGSKNRDRERWIQPGTSVDLQFNRSGSAHRDADKLRSQVSFLSETPRADREKLATWAQAHALEANVGSYSDKEFFLDAPGAYIVFVIEAMRSGAYTEVCSAPSTRWNASRARTVHEPVSATCRETAEHWSNPRATP